MRAVAVGMVFAALLAVGPTTAGTGSASRLHIASDAPVVIAGSGFRPYERVRLLIAAPGPATRIARAGGRGRFRVVLRFSMPRCGGVVVQAFGSRGSRAMVDRIGLDCASIG
jgi:hypothetical protein